MAVRPSPGARQFHAGRSPDPSSRRCSSVSGTPSSLSRAVRTSHSRDTRANADDRQCRLDVPDRVLFKLAVTVHQCLNGRAPPEHCIPVSSADTRRHLRSANRHLLAVPRFPLNTYGRRAFSVAGPMAWNSLPDFILDPASSTDSFRRPLKKYLFARY